MTLYVKRLLCLVSARRRYILFLIALTFVVVVVHNPRLAYQRVNYMTKRQLFKSVDCFVCTVYPLGFTNQLLDAASCIESASYARIPSRKAYLAIGGFKLDLYTHQEGKITDFLNLSPSFRENIYQKHGIVLIDSFEFDRIRLQSDVDVVKLERNLAGYWSSPTIWETVKSFSLQHSTGKLLKLVSKGRVKAPKKEDITLGVHLRVEPDAIIFFSLGSKFWHDWNAGNDGRDDLGSYRYLADLFLGSPLHKAAMTCLVDVFAESIRKHTTSESEGVYLATGIGKGNPATASSDWALDYLAKSVPNPLWIMNVGEATGREISALHEVNELVKLKRFIHSSESTFALLAIHLRNNPDNTFMVQAYESCQHVWKTLPPLGDMYGAPTSVVPG